MFDSAQPPLMVFSMTPEQAGHFPVSDGFVHHPISESRILVCYKTGWTFPVSVQNREFITEAPYLFVRNKGQVTSQGSTFLKGYGHQVVNDAGREPDCFLKHAVLPDNPDVEWMLVQNKVNMIWLQYGYKNQYLESGYSDMIKYHYGKLMIIKLSIEEDTVPRIDKKADIAGAHDKQYRVCDQHVYKTNWHLVDQDPVNYLFEQLSLNDLDRYKDAVRVTMLRAGYEEA